MCVETTGESTLEGIEFGPLISVATPGKARWSVRQLMIGVAVVAFLFGIVRPAYLALDAIAHGPVTLAFNRSCQRLADEARLIGKPEAEVVKALGVPTDIWEYDQPYGRTRTFNYWPSRFVPAGIFQVHYRGGVVVILEQLDD